MLSSDSTVSGCKKWLIMKWNRKQLKGYDGKSCQSCLECLWNVRQMYWEDIQYNTYKTISHVTTDITNRSLSHSRWIPATSSLRTCVIGSGLVLSHRNVGSHALCCRYLLTIYGRQMKTMWQTCVHSFPSVSEKSSGVSIICRLYRLSLFLSLHLASFSTTLSATTRKKNI